MDRCEVWVARLSELRPHKAALAAALTPAERADGGGHTDTTTGTLSRAVLRLVLARYLGTPAEQVEIDRRCQDCGRLHGQPRLRRSADGEAPPLQFSVSHGGDLLVLAVAGEGQVGVDVEPERPDRAVEQDLLEHALTPAEQRHLASVPDDQRHRLFLHYWTGKEAVLKALGTGLDASLHAVTLPPPPRAGSTSVVDPGGDPVDFAVRYLDVGPGHICALATGDPVPDFAVSWLSASTLLDTLSR